MKRLCLLMAFCMAAPAAQAEPFRLRAELHEGSKYDERNLPSDKIEKWYKIPPWFAGTKIRKKINIKPGVSVRNERERTRGKQLDAKGSIWEAQRQVRYDIDRGETVEHVVLLTEEPVEISNQSVLMHYIGLRIIEKKDNHRIVETQQNDEKHLFTPLPEGAIKGENKSGDVFDADGFKLFKIPPGTSYVERRVSDFEVVDQDDKYNYRSSFIEFLKEQGWDNLIPKRVR